MNKYQRIVVVVMALDLVLMLLFPPFLDSPIRRGMQPSLDGFYPLFSSYGIQHIHKELLTLEVLFVTINGLIAWLALDRTAPAGELPEFRYSRVIGIFALANIAFLLLFPPFEEYSSFMKPKVPAFDSFYFVAGDKRHRNVFIPLLYLEITLVVINALVIWLLFNTLSSAQRLAKERIIELAKDLPPEDLVEVSKTLGYKAIRLEPNPGHHDPHLGSGPDRRHYQDPRYRGPERRRGGDRRHKSRATA